MALLRRDVTGVVLELKDLDRLSLFSLLPVIVGDVSSQPLLQPPCPPPAAMLSCHDGDRGLLSLWNWKLPN